VKSTHGTHAVEACRRFVQEQYVRVGRHLDRYRIRRYKNKRGRGRGKERDEAKKKKKKRKM
jgi:hypothetical protein